MIQKNDFAEVLLEHIKGIQDKIPSKLGYLAEKEGLVLYPLPGGEVVDEDMALKRSAYPLKLLSSHEIRN